MNVTGRKANGRILELALRRSSGVFVPCPSCREPVELSLTGRAAGTSRCLHCGVELLQQATAKPDRRSDWNEAAAET